MFSRLSSIVLLLPMLVVATAIPRATDIGGDQCNTGSLMCCNSVQDATSQSSASLLGMIGFAQGPLTGLVGLTCNPFSLGGIGKISCSAQPLCCSNNHFSGAIAVGCMPFNLG